MKFLANLPAFLGGVAIILFFSPIIIAYILFVRFGLGATEDAGIQKGAHL